MCTIGDVRRPLIGIVLIPTVMAVAPSTPVAGQTTIIAYSEDRAPLPDSDYTYGTFLSGTSQPVLTNSGDIWFSSRFEGDDPNDAWELWPDSAIYVLPAVARNGGSPQLVVRQDVPPDPAYDVSFSLLDPSDHGDAGVDVRVENDSTLRIFHATSPLDGDRGDWQLDQNGKLTFLTHRDFLPIAPTEELQNSYVSTPTSQGWRILFGTTIEGNRRIQHLYQYSPDGSVELVAENYGEAPGLPAGSVFGSRLFPFFDQNESGTILFGGYTFPSLDDVPIEGDPTSRVGGLWRKTPGQVASKVVATGDVLPGTDMPVLRTYGQGINRSGDVAFIARLSDSELTDYLSHGIWVDSSETGLRNVLLGNQPMPGVSDEFVVGPTNMGEAYLSDNGDVTVYQHITNGDTYRGGIWQEGGDGLELVALEAAAASDAGAGTRWRDISRPSMNSRGQLLFMADLELGVGGVTEFNDSGVWAQDHEGNVRLVMREGDTIVYGNKELVVSSVFFSEDRPINNRGEILLTVGFTDMSEAIMLSRAVAIPEPLSVSILAFGGLLLGTAFRRRLTG